MPVSLSIARASAHILSTILARIITDYWMGESTTGSLPKANDFVSTLKSHWRIVTAIDLSVNIDIIVIETHTFPLAWRMASTLRKCYNDRRCVSKLNITWIADV